MHTRHFFVISMLVLLAIAGFIVIRPSTDLAPTSKVTDPSQYLWKFDNREPGAYGDPRTSITLSLKGKTYLAGVYSGSCRALSSTEVGVTGDRPDKNEITRVQCWWAGSGDEIGVFIENGKAVLKVGELGEGGPTDAAFRGNFKVINTL